MIPCPICGDTDYQRGLERYWVNLANHIDDHLDDEWNGRWFCFCGSFRGLANLANHLEEIGEAGLKEHILMSRIANLSKIVCPVCQRDDYQPPFVTEHKKDYTAPSNAPWPWMLLADHVDDHLREPSKWRKVIKCPCGATMRNLNELAFHLMGLGAENLRQHILATKIANL